MQPVSIEIAEQAFNQWRQTRSNQTETIPSKLWNIAISLHPHYKQSYICQRLRLSGGQFKQHLEASFNPDNIGDGFVLATTEEPNITKATELPQSLRETTLTLQGKDRALSLRLSVLDLPVVLPHFETLL